MTDHVCGPGCQGTHISTAQVYGDRPPLPIIDLHCHIATPAVEPLVAGRAERLAEISATRQGQGQASTDYNRTVMMPACMAKMTNLAGRLVDMDAMGVDVQVLSPSPGQYYYWADRDLAETIVALQNDHIADCVSQHPDRLVGLAAVSLQHPDLAAIQLEHAVKRLGLKGVEVSTSAGGRELGDPALEPFWAVAERLGALVFIHPLGSSLGARLDQHYLANTIGQPIETTIALSHIIFGGVLDRRPGLKLVAAHGGGYLPTYAGRSDHAWKARPDARSMNNPLSTYLKRIFFDNLVYTPQGLRALIDQVGVSQVVVGTDYPFDMGAYDVQALVNATPGLTNNEREAIWGGNALQLLGLDARAFRNGRRVPAQA